MAVHVAFDRICSQVIPDPGILAEQQVVYRGGKIVSQPVGQGELEPVLGSSQNRVGQYILGGNPEDSFCLQT